MTDSTNSNADVLKMRRMLRNRRATRQAEQVEDDFADYDDVKTSQNADETKQDSLTNEDDEDIV